MHGRSKVTEENSSERDLCETFHVKQRKQMVQDLRKGNISFSMVSWGNFLLADMGAQPFHIKRKVVRSVSKPSGLLIFTFRFRYYSFLLYSSIYLWLAKFMLYTVSHHNEFCISTGDHIGNWASMGIRWSSLGPEWLELFLCWVEDWFGSNNYF